MSVLGGGQPQTAAVRIDVLVYRQVFDLVDRGPEAGIAQRHIVDLVALEVQFLRVVGNVWVAGCGCDQDGVACSTIWAGARSAQASFGQSEATARLVEEFQLCRTRVRVGVDAAMDESAEAAAVDAGGLCADARDLVVAVAHEFLHRFGPDVLQPFGTT